MLMLLKTIKAQAHKIQPLEALRQHVHDISAPAPDIKPVTSKANGIDIHYHPTLISEFSAEHQKLISQLTATEQALSQKNFRKLHDNLETFSINLGEHILKKNIKLYVYLQHTLKSRKETNSTINLFKRGMISIGRKTNAFLNRHEASVLNGEIKPAFASELKEIITALTKHTEKEECDLYPLYQPPTNLAQTG